MIGTAEADRQALLRREAVVSVVVNALISVGFFLVVFGWKTTMTRSLALDFLPQTVGITLIGGLIPSLITLSKIKRGRIVPAGAVPTRWAQFGRIVIAALIAMVTLGGGAALLLLAFGPAAMAPLPALLMKAGYGGLTGLITTPPIVRMALGMPLWSRTRHDRGEAR